MFIFTMLSLSSKLFYLYTYINKNYSLNKKWLCKNPRGGVYPPYFHSGGGGLPPPSETTLVKNI